MRILVLGDVVGRPGRKFLSAHLKTFIENKNVLDLVNVRGKISSSNRDTIYIVSDYGQFNSVNSSSKFYDNVVINYQEKQITCKNFDINMETNKAIAYNDVIITDPNSEGTATRVSECKPGRVGLPVPT